MPAACLARLRALLTAPAARPLLLALLTYVLAFAMRMLELPSWSNPEYSMGGERLLATHDAYHWVAGAEGFEFGVGHPMSELLRILAAMTFSSAAEVAFWLPAMMASLVAVVVFGWAWAMGAMEVGVCAGVLASLAPGFLARTLLGYCDTDLVTLLFPLLMGLAPAFWVVCFLRTPQEWLTIVLWRLRNHDTALEEALAASNHAVCYGGTWRAEILHPLWTVMLALCGLLGWWGQEWHSMFPYLVRYNTVLLVCLIGVLGKPGTRRQLFTGALIYALPMLGGVGGFAVALLVALAASGRWPKAQALLRKRTFVAGLWVLVLVLFLDVSVFQTMLNSAASYIKRSGDVADKATAIDPLVYPSVAQSIIEVQDLSIPEVLAYFHPWHPLALAGVVGFCLLAFVRPDALFLLPLLGLGFLSVKLGGRMVMFGAPIMALGLCVPLHYLAGRILRDDLRRFRPRFAISLLLLCIFGWPFVDVIPAMTQGPILNRRHAEALRHIRDATPADSFVWVWWDWGYSTHYFARRSTIADGASHGGPSLYVPAATFTTDNPRFARQFIKYTASKGNVPGNVFENLKGSEAADLMHRLRTQDMKIEAPGSQYIVVSFDMLRLGFWISTFGNWDFLTRESKGYAISMVPQQLSYSLDNGEILVHGNASRIQAATIDVFGDGKLDRRDYIMKRDPHNENAIANYYELQQNLENRRNVHFLFNKVTGEKLVVDDQLYNSLMVQLLVCSPDDTRFAPHFRLVYDNVFTRVYEVL